MRRGSLFKNAAIWSLMHSWGARSRSTQCYTIFSRLKQDQNGHMSAFACVESVSCVGLKIGGANIWALPHAPQERKKRWKEHTRIMQCASQERRASIRAANISNLIRKASIESHPLIWPLGAFSCILHFDSQLEANTNQNYFVLINRTQVKHPFNGFQDTSVLVKRRVRRLTFAGFPD